MTPSDEQKGIRELHQDFKNKKSHRQTNYHQYLFYMSISDHRNGLAPTIEFKCKREKQDKRLNNHHFPLHLPQKTRHNSGNPRYVASKWYSINLQWIPRM